MAKKDGVKEKEERPKRTRETVAQVAHALRHRDQIVTGSLEFLEASGFLAEETRSEVQRAYELGDTATRLAVQELLARVLRVPLEALHEELAEGRLDPARVSRTHLKALEELRLPRIDVDAVGERIRGFDVEGLVARHAGDTKLVTFVTDVPVMLNRLRLGLLLGGVGVLVVAAVILLFPQYAAWIAFYGLVAFFALLGGLMVTWAVRLERGARDLGLDLVVFARLDPEERRILVLRRLVLGLTDTRRLGDLVEKGLHSMLPDRMQAPRRGTVPEPQRPLTVSSADAPEVATRETASGSPTAGAKRRPRQGAAAKEGRAAQARTPAKRTTDKKTGEAKNAKKGSADAARPRRGRKGS